MYDCPTRAACIAGIKGAFTWNLRTGIMNHNSLLNLLRLAESRCLQAMLSFGRDACGQSECGAGVAEVIQPDDG